MLSFLNEDENSQELPEGITDASKDVQGELESQSPESQDDYLMPSTTGKTVKNSTILLTILLVVGASVVWVMVKKVGPREASAESSQEDMQIETAIAKLTGIQSEMYAKLDKVAEKFYQFSNIHQVSSDQLIRNPFIYAPGVSGVMPSVKGGGYKSEKKNNNLRLWSVMESEQGRCCMIGDKILYVGDTIDGMVVNQIGKNAVELKSNNQSVILRMSQ